MKIILLFISVRLFNQFLSACAFTSERSKIPTNSEVTIAVMGATGSGKTSFINLVSGSDFRIGRGLKSCTSTVQVSKPFELDDRHIVLIDTPGFDDTYKSDTDILRIIAHYLATTYEEGKLLTGVVFVHRISDIRLGGISRRNFEMFRELCGGSALENVVIVTNMWDEVSQDVGELREHELETDDSFFGSAISQGAQLLRHNNTVESAQAILRHIIHKDPLPLRIQNEIVDEKKELSEAAAAMVLNRDLIAQEQKHLEEKENTERRIREANEKAKRELEDELRRQEAERVRALDNMRKWQQEAAAERARLQQILDDDDDDCVIM